MPIKSPKWRKGHIVERQNNDRIERALFKLRKSGILPREGQELTEDQKKIYLQAINGELSEQPLIQHTSQAPTLEFIIWSKIQEKASLEGQNFLLTVDDVIVPKTCPYFGIELSYDAKDRDKQYYFAIDRIDRDKMYEKDNIIILSKKAYIIRNLCPIEDLITFAENVLKIHQIK